MFRVFLSTAEVSADEQAAGLVKEINKKFPGEFTFTALGGEALRKAGCRIYRDITTESSVGFFESLPYIGSSLSLFSDLKDYFQNEEFDLFLAVDGQGRNVSLGKVASDVGMETVWYFPPVAFIWDAGLLKKIGHYSLFLCPFKENALLYQRNGLNAFYTGHPFSLLNPGNTTDLDVYRKFNLSENSCVLAVFPGSRRQEIKKTAPLLFKSARLIQKKFEKKYPKKNLEIMIPVSHRDYKIEIEILADQLIPSAHVVMGQSDDILKISKAAVMTSGTATLKALFYDVPTAICYKISFFSWFLAKFIFKIRFAGMGNILAGKEISKEFINGQLKPEKVSDYILPLLTNTEAAAGTCHEMSLLKKNISVKDPFGHAASVLYDYLISKNMKKKEGTS